MNNWSSRIDISTKGFLEAFGSLTTEELNWKPDSNTWSIAQNIDHIITINNTFFPVVDSIRSETYSIPFWGKMGFVVSFFGKMLLKSVQPKTKTKAKTFAIWEPSKSNIPDVILQRFADHQEALKSLIESSQDLIAKGTVISSPASRSVVYKLESAFEIIVVHETRHLEQANRVLKLMNESK